MAAPCVVNNQEPVEPPRRRSRVATTALATCFDLLTGLVALPAARHDRIGCAAEIRLRHTKRERFTEVEIGMALFHFD